MTFVFSGHDLAERLNAETGEMLNRLGRPASLMLIHDSTSEAATKYAARIGGFAQKLGIRLHMANYDRLDAVTAQIEGSDADAILPLTPMPAGVDPLAMTDLIGPARDADGQHALNMGALALGDARIAPPTAMAAFLCAAEIAGDLQGRRVAIVGSSPRVGRPLALLMMNAGATVSVANEFTRDLAAVTRNAEVIVSATGVAGLITADHVAEGAVILDVGIIATPQGLVGDVDQAAVMGRASAISHVPDGVGPVTTACLMRNVAVLAGAQARKGTKADG